MKVSTEIIVAFFSALTLLVNLIFLIVTRVTDNKKDIQQRQKKKGFELCLQWKFFYSLEELYIKEISRLRKINKEEKINEKSIKEEFRDQVRDTRKDDEKLLKPSEVNNYKKLFME